MKKGIFMAFLLTVALLFTACGPIPPKEELPPEPVAAEPQEDAESQERAEPQEMAEPQAESPVEKIAELETITVSEEEVVKAVPKGVITRAGDMPRIDGSTACIPLMLKMLEQACGLSEDEALPYYTASGTQNCWDRLYAKEADLVLAYEIPADTDQLCSRDRLDMEPIGRDALVFLVNERNPVTNLTRQQLIDIYTGRITNWSQVGGENEEIHAIQRDASSGSQTLFRKLLMKDVEPMEPPQEFRIASMDYLVEEIAGYDNAKNDLGFSVYYYVSQMKIMPGVRLLSVDGVAPSNETIADGSYPLTNDFYAAISHDAIVGSGTRRLYDWICGEEGEKCLIDAGYVPTNG